MFITPVFSCRDLLLGKPSLVYESVGMYIFFKYNIGFLMSVFILLIMKQLIFEEEIQWIHNIMYSILFYLVYNLWEWLIKPINKNVEE